MVEKIGRVDELIKSKFLKKDVSEPEKEEVDVGKLNHILNLNRQSKNNFRIYSEA